jgi:two-component system, OmpR family, sensor histidine kinase VicK
MRVSLRTKILAAILGAVLLTDALAVWAVNDRIEAGARRESDAQTRAQAAQTRALYDQRAATLAAEGEAISLYPAVIAAVTQGNAAPLLDWSSKLSTLQGLDVTVVDVSGKVIARGHQPEVAGDMLAPKLEGMQLALTGVRVVGAEQGDELGLALRGYAPVKSGGQVVGAVMIADRFEERLLERLAGAEAATDLRVSPAPAASESCSTPSGDASATCRFNVLSPSGRPIAALTLTVPLTEINQSRADAQQALWLIGALVALGGVVAAVVLAQSLSRPLARLTASAERISAGDYAQPTGVRGSDEIGALAGAFDTMRTQVARTTTALRDERDVLDAVLDSTGDGIIMTDATGRLLVANRRWSEQIGGAGLGAAAALAPTGGAEASFGAAARGWLADADRVTSGDFERFEPYRRYRCYTAPVRYREGIAGRIFVLRDVTRESEAERMRTALISTVSHELRSPLTAIKGYTDSLLDAGPWDEESEREFLQIIAVSAEKLSGLVDNLLDAAKMEAGVLRLDREPVRVERIVWQVASHKRALAPNHPITVDIAPDLPLADADPVRVEQVVTNLVENAIKYSPEGGPITVRVTGGNALTVSVSDRGVGITPEHAEKLFERFYRVDSSLARSTKGVGLGLYICKSLVEAHGGRIWVESVPGRGSTFAFTLPALAGAEPADVRGSARVGAASMTYTGAAELEARPATTPA